MEHIYHDAVQVPKAPRTRMVRLVFSRGEEKLCSAAGFAWGKRHDIWIGLTFSCNAHGQVGYVQTANMAAGLTYLFDIIFSDLSYSHLYLTR